MITLYPVFHSSDKQKQLVKNTILPLDTVVHMHACVHMYCA